MVELNAQYYFVEREPSAAKSDAAICEIGCKMERVAAAHGVAIRTRYHRNAAAGYRIDRAELRSQEVSGEVNYVGRPLPGFSDRGLIDIGIDVHPLPVNRRLQNDLEEAVHRYNRFAFLRHFP